MSSLPSLAATRKNLARIVLFAVLIVFAFAQLFPLLWVFSYSIQKSGDLFGPELFKFPADPQWTNYSKAWVDGKIPLYSLNSTIVVAVSTIASTVLSFCLAYALTRLKWKLRGVVSAIISLGMIIPIHTTLLPNFLWFKEFGLINTHLGLIIPYVAFTLSFNTLVYIGYLRTLPVAMEESAFMDGASWPRILWSIIAPMAAPASLTVVVMTALNNWNEFIMANTFLASDELRTLPFAIINFQGQYSSQYAIQFACMMLVALPPLILFFFASKWIMGGVTAGAVKG